MKRLLLTAGLILTLLPAAASAAEKSLYETMKETVKTELAENGYDKEIIDFLVKIFAVPESAIRSALKGDEDPAACESARITQRGECLEFVLRVIRAAKQEAAIRKIGKQMQEAAGGEEVPVSYMPGRPVSVMFDLSAIVNIWATGDKAPINLGEDTSLSVKQLEPDVTDSLLTDLSSTLKLLSEDERTAAVWRYEAGLLLVDEKRGTQFPKPYEFEQNAPGTDLQLLNKRWRQEPGNIEAKLQAIWDALPPDEGIENKITYFVFPNMADKMPENIIVWARKGQRRENGRLADYGDVGLAWKIPMVPVFPSLLKRDAAGQPEEAIRGGFYPPEPVIPGTKTAVDGGKLCSDPVASKGFLCPQKNAKGCPVPEGTNPNAITLTNCVTGTGSLTLAGADVCRDIEWRASPPRSKNASGFLPAKQCYVTLSCKDGPFTGGLTESKQGDGGIAVSVNPNAKLPATYYWIHELTHAIQACSEAPGSPYVAGPNPQNPFEGLTQEQRRKNIETCCRREGEAYRAQCDAMEEDGRFFDGNGVRKKVYGVELNATVCAEAFTDYSCAARFGGNCTVTRTYPNNAPTADETNTFAGQLELAAGSSTSSGKQTPSTCSASIDPKQMDLRMQTQLATIAGMYKTSDPLNETRYRNSLGNNLCYAGDAAERTFELHNVIGGRSPFLVGDQAQPFVTELGASGGAGSAASSAGSRASTGSGDTFAVMDQPLGKLPQYKPKELAEQFDLSLCQQQGLPVQSPPVLCTLQYARRLQLPIGDYILNAESLLQQESDSQQPLALYRDLSSGLGSRIGTGLYELYAPRALGTVESLMKEAVRQLKLLSTVKFPDAMCPIGPS